MRKEHPILFSTIMVQALLAGRKTQTRRTAGLNHINEVPGLYQLEGKPYHNFPEFGDDLNTYCDFISKDGTSGAFAKCPYGQVGDILWARESFITGHKMNENDVFATNPLGNYVNHTWFRASAPDLRWFDGESDFPKERPPWKPSIHMPKAACRIWLEITDIRVERIGEIGDIDVFAEGVSLGDFPYDTPLSALSGLWIKINGPESWEANPFVWALTFKVLSTTGKPTIANSIINQ